MSDGFSTLLEESTSMGERWKWMLTFYFFIFVFGILGFLVHILWFIPMVIVWIMLGVYYFKHPDRIVSWDDYEGDEWHPAHFEGRLKEKDAEVRNLKERIKQLEDELQKEKKNTH
jgi:sensor histidine kinase YesM